MNDLTSNSIFVKIAEINVLKNVEGAVTAEFEMTYEISIFRLIEVYIVR